MELENANPVVFEAQTHIKRDTSMELDEDVDDPLDALELFDLIRDIKDPEHPLTLEQLNVVKHELIELDEERQEVLVQFTPTIPHCSMATLIGLCIKVKMIRSLPESYKIDVEVEPGTHATEAAVNKQLNDKERVAAALENSSLIGVVNNCLRGL